MKTWPIIVSKGYPGGWGDESVQAETTISPESPPTTESGAEYKYTEVAQRNTKEEEIMSSLNSFIVEIRGVETSSSLCMSNTFPRLDLNFGHGGSKLLQIMPMLSLD